MNSGLELVGRQAKDIIINYLDYKYGLTVDSVLSHKQEFDNYLREILGESAGIVLTRIDRFLEETRAENGQVQRRENWRQQSSAALSNDGNGNDNSAVISNTKRQSSKLLSAKKQRLSYAPSFIICDQCFWCATLLTSNYQLKCQSCGHKIPSAVSIAVNETFSLEIGPKRGITLSFR